MTDIKNTGTLTGRVLYDGEPPAPQFLQIPVRARVVHDGLKFDTEEMPERRRLQAHGVPDESLIVSEDRGIANVVVWLRSKDVPIPPAPRLEPLQPVSMHAVNGRFKPHVLVFWNASSLKLINDSGAATNFNWQGILNKALTDGQEFEVKVDKPRPIPVSLTSNIHPWFEAYAFPLAHPYFAMTGDDGRFKINHLPRGEWEFAIWHERSGWLETDKYPRGRFKCAIKPGKNDLGDLNVAPQVIQRRAPQRFLRGEAKPKSDHNVNAISVLHGAVMQGNLQRVEDSIKIGMNVNDREPRLNGTPLHYAARHGHGAISRVLIEKGATIDARDINKCTPLVWAAKGGHAHVIRQLLDAKADVNAQDSRGWTALHFAMDRGQIEAAQLLIDRGADLHVKNREGKTPLELKPELEINVPSQSLGIQTAEQ